MILSDSRSRGPVFAAVLSLLLVAFGWWAFDRLPLREYPDIDPPVVSIETTYRARRERRRDAHHRGDRGPIAGVERIRLIDSKSEDGRSRDQRRVRVGQDIDAAANDIRDRVATVVDDLPAEADPPEVRKVDSNDNVILWLNLASDRLTVPELDRLRRAFTWSTASRCSTAWPASASAARSARHADLARPGGARGPRADGRGHRAACGGERRAAAGASSRSTPVHGAGEPRLPDSETSPRWSSTGRATATWCGSATSPGRARRRRGPHAVPRQRRRDDRHRIIKQSVANTLGVRARRRPRWNGSTRRCRPAWSCGRATTPRCSSRVR